MKKSVLFIDGNNLYHNLKVMHINPGDLDFDKLTKIVSNHFKTDLIEVRYYNSMPSIKDGEGIYFGHLKFIESLKKFANFAVLTRKLQVHSTKELVKEMKEILDSIPLCLSCKPLVENKLFRLIGKVKKREKGIDVMISVDFVEYAIKKKAETLILFSGDADFIPAMNLAKENNVEVFSSSVYKGYSQELRDKFIFFPLGSNFIIQNCLKN